MAADYLQTDFSKPDFSFVYDLDDQGLELFFNVTDLGIDAMKEALLTDLNTDERYLKELSAKGNKEVSVFYHALLELYTDYELYEECDDILFILDTLSRYFIPEQELVANVN